ncbi:MAG: LacI family DNA-binding transcriptional regulator [Rhodobacteraceae bacterium]|nr:LacI family DNA-binding transcriptional regulator [Paracoccaceae bacterium]
MGQAATIKDVAQRAGCGVATVSRVLNNTGPASAEMRERVLAAVDALDFQFSEVGRSLQSNTTRTIGCVVPSIENPVYADAVQGAQEVFRNAGYQMLLICTNYSPEIETNAIRTLVAKQVDGVLLTVADAQKSEGLDLVRSRRLPHSLLFNEAPDGEVSWSVGDHAAAALVADKFAMNNHKNTGFLALNFLNSDRARQRYEGFVEGCAKNAMAPPALLEVDDDGHDLTDHLRGFLHDHPDLTGIFASNDFLALATIRSARNLFIKVPQELSIVGFDGIKVGLMVEPSLATIVTAPRDLGAGAGQTILSLINGTSPPERPSKNSTFSFRAGGSLMPLPAESKDDGKVAAFPPSNDPTQKTA